MKYSYFPTTVCKSLKNVLQTSFLLILLGLISFSPTQAQTTDLQPGEIAFIGFYRDGADEFSFITLRELDVSTVIHFTDHGWNDGSGFSSHGGEAILTWTGPAAIVPCGTVVTITAAGANINTASLGTITTNGSNMVLSSNGDQIFAYQGTHANPSLIAGIHSEIVPAVPAPTLPLTVTNDANWDGASTGNSFSALPDVLTNGVNAVRLHVSESEIDNFIYDCSIFNGDASTILAAVNDLSNWNASNSTPPQPGIPGTQIPFPCTFTVSNCFTGPGPSCPTITFTVSSVDESCPGLNDGSISIGGETGGTAPYEYSIDGGSNYQSSPTFTGLAPGSYTVRIRDANGCESGDTPVTINAALDNTAPVIGHLVCESSSAAASSTAYDDGWDNGDNDGAGFGPWALTTAGTAGHFVSTSTNNGDGDTNTDGDIDTDNRALGMFANSGGLANALRPLLVPMAPLDELRFEIDNGFIDTGFRTGFALQNASGETLLDFYFEGGLADYKLVDLNGINNTGIPFTDEGIQIEIVQLDLVSCNVLVTPLGGSSSVFTSPLLSPAGGQVISQVDFYNANAGFNPTNDFFVNNLEICHKTAGCPANITVNNDAGLCSAVVNFEACATDDCDPNPTLTFTPASGSTFPLGLTIVTGTATDASGNTSTCSFNVIVEDMEDPTITCPANITQSNDPGECEATVTVPVPAAMDNCSVLGSPTPFPADFTTQTTSQTSGVIGTTTVTMVCAGGAFYITGDPLNTIDNNSNQLTNPEHVPPIANTDMILTGMAVGGTVTITFGAPVVDPALYLPYLNDDLMISGSPVLLSGTAGISVIGNTLQVLGQGGATVQVIGTYTSITLTGTSTDGIGILPAILSPALSLTNDFNGTADASGDYPVGTTTVTWTATDGAGNSTSCSHTVTVEDTEDPTISCPADITAYAFGSTCSNLVTGTDLLTHPCVEFRNGPPTTVGTSLQFPIPPGVGVKAFAPVFFPGAFTTGTPYSIDVSTTFTRVVSDTDFRIGFTDGTESDFVGIYFLENGGGRAYKSEASFSPGATTVPDNLSSFVGCGGCAPAIGDQLYIDATITVSAAGNVSIVGQLTGDGSAGVANFSYTYSSIFDAATGLNFMIVGEDDAVLTAQLDSISISCPGTPCAAELAFAVPFSDNCPGATLAQTNGLPSGSSFPVGTTNQAFTVTDASGNTASCSFDITVIDTTAPYVVCQDIDVYLDGSGNVSITTADVTKCAVDNCAVTSLTASPLSFTCANIGANTVTLTAMDAAGNTSTCTATVTVHDTISPVAVCQNIDVYLDGSGNVSITGTDVDGGSTDNCAVTGLSVTPSSFTCANTGTNTVTLTVSDASGNSSTCTATVTVIDSISPTISCPVDITQANDAGLCSAVVNFTTTSSDNCPGETVVCTPASGSTFPVGTTVVNCVVTDASGNTNSCSFNVVVEDTASPVITCPADITVNNDPGICGAAVTVPAPTVTDNCDALTLGNALNFDGVDDIALVAATSPINTLTQTQRTVEVYFRVNDKNINSRKQVIWEEGGHTNGLNLYVYDGRLYVGAYSKSFGWTGNWISTPLIQSAQWHNAVIVYDGTLADPTQRLKGYLDGTLFGTEFGGTQLRDHSDANAIGGMNSRAVFHDGQTVITLGHYFSGDIDEIRLWTVARTAAELQATNTQQLAGNEPGLEVYYPMDQGVACGNNTGVNMILDFTATGLDGNMSNFALDGSLGCVSNWTDGAPALSSSITLVNSFTGTASASSTYPVGTTTVTFTATDASGNVDSCSFNVVVNDTEAPNAVCQNIDVYLDGSGNASITAAQIDGGSSDNCGVTGLSVTPSSFTCANTGANTVTLTVSDAAGNSSTCTATVTVNDSTPPTAVCQNIDVYLDGSGNATIAGADLDGGSSDNCGVTGLSVTPSSFTCANTGPNTVTLTVSDAAGNSSTCTATVTVIDSIPPVAVCQAVTVYLDAGGSASITGAQIDGGSSDNCGPPSLSVNPSTFDCADINVVNGCGSFALDFDGVDEYGESANNLTHGDNFTYEAWLFVTTVGGFNFQGIVTTFTPGVENDHLVQMSVNSTGRLVGEIKGALGNDNRKIYTGNTVLTNGWHHVAITFDGTNFLLYVDAVQQTTTASDDDLVGGLAVNRKILLGAERRKVSNGFTDQTLDEVRIWNVTRSAADIQNSYLSCFTGSEPGLIMYYQIEAGTGSTVTDLVSGNNATLINMENSDWVPAAPVLQTSPGAGVTLIVTDASGNVDSCTANVTVLDTIPPTISCPSNITQDNDAGLCSAVVTFADPTFSDNCSGATVTCSPASGTVFQVGTTTVTCIATDSSGNVDSCSFTITVNDTEAPVASCTNISVDLGAANPYTLTPANIDAIAAGSSDNCPGFTYAITSGQTTYDCSDLGQSFTVVLTVTDASGNTDTCHADVSVTDVTSVCNGPPVAVCQDITVYVDANCEASITPAQVDGGSTDPDGDILTLTLDNSGPFAPGIHMVILTVDDGQFTDTCHANVTVLDTIPPTIICPADITVDNDSGLCQAAVTVPTPTVTDNCDTLNFGNAVNFDGIDDIGLVAATSPINTLNQSQRTVEVYFRVNDKNINSRKQVIWEEGGFSNGLNLYVYDGRLYVGVYSISLGWSGNWISTPLIQSGQWHNAVIVYDGTLADPTQRIKGYLDGTLIGSASAGTQLRFHLGENAIGGMQNWAVFHDGVDNSTLGHYFGGDIDEIRLWTVPRTAAELQATNTQQLAGNEPGLEVYYPMDQGVACGNNTGVNMILDITTTALHGNMANFALDGSLGCVSNWTDGAPALSSSITLVNSFTGTANASSSYPVGTTTVTYIATDASGNVDSCSFNVVVNDTEAPNAVCQNIDVYLDGSGNASITAADVDGGSTDNCSITGLSVTPNTFTCADTGANTVTLTVTDSTGNSSTCTAIVTVQDTIPPIVVCQDITVQLDATGNVSILPADVNAPTTYSFVNALAPNLTSGFTRDIAVADLNNDGHDDVMIASQYSEDRIYLGDGAGNFTLHQAIPTSATSQSHTVKFAHLNGDAFLDVMYFMRNRFDVWYNDGTGMMTQHSFLSVQCRNGDIGDFNNDGFMDAFTSHEGGNRVLINDGTNNFTVTQTFGGGGFQVDVNVADINNDGDLDVVSGIGTTINIFENDGTGTFSIGAQTFPGTAPQRIMAVGDLNGDGAPEIASGTNLFLNDGAGNFTFSQFLSSSGKFLDADGDGDLDYFGAASNLYVNDGTGTLTFQWGFGGGATYNGIAMGDFNSDGKMDIITGTENATAIWNNTTVLGLFDNCGTPTLSVSPSSFTCANIGTNTVTLIATDASGNTDSCTATVTVQDTLPPIALCQNIDVYLDGSGNASITAAEVDGGSSDNCTIVSLSVTPNTFTCADTGANTVTLTVTDSVGNSSTCTATVTVNDTIPPVAVCNDLIVDLGVANPYTLTPANIDAIAAGSSDNCPGFTYAITSGQTTYDCSDLGQSFMVVLTVTDASGNTDTCHAEVSVTDVTSVCNDPPVAVCQDITVYVDANCEASITPAQVDGGSTDPDGDPLTLTLDNSGPFEPGIHMVILTVDDGQFTDTCHANVTVLDSISPTISCPSPVTVDNDLGLCSADVMVPQPTINDNCIVVPVELIANGDFNAATANWTDCGNLAESTFETVYGGSDPTNRVAEVDPQGGPPTSNDRSLCQDVSGFQIGIPYELTFLASRRQTGGTPNPLTVDVVIDGGALSTSVTRTNTTFALTPESFVFVATQTTHRLTITPSVQYNSGEGMILDDISILQVPLVLTNDFNGTDDASGVYPVGTTDVIWTVTDFSGNTAQCTTSVTVNDAEAPVPPMPPAFLEVQCASDVPAPVDLTATDNCDGPITVSPVPVITPGSCPNDFVMVRTWTFTDMAGNTTSISQTIVVSDTTAPAAPPAPADVTVECASDVPAPVDLTATDNCDGPITVSPVPVITPGSCPNDFVMVRTWTFVDTCGNTSSVSQTITVSDTTAPATPPAPADVTVECASDVPAPVDLTAIDNCDGPITVSPVPVITPGSCPNDFVMVRTWTFVDTCGNTSSVSQTITVSDTTAPATPTPPADVTVECASDVPAPVDLTAIDNCDGPITVSPVPVITPGTCPNDFVMVRTWTFVDTCGNTSSVSQTITVSDTTAPAAPTPPADVTVECASDVPAPVDLTAIDNCDGPITVSPVPVITPGSCPNDFVMVRTWTFVDTCGNTSSVSQTITVSDTTAPATPPAPADVTVECASDVPAPVDLTAIDNCDGPITVSPVPVITPGSCPNDFVMVRTWTFVDTCGNTSSVSQTITVSDTTAPAAPTPPADVTVECASDVPAPVDLTATDNCDGAITVSPVPVITPGSCPNDFVMVRTWTFVDTCGNTSSVSQTITVSDTTAPVFTCPADITVQADANCEAVATYSATATDNCDGTVPVLFSPISGSTFQIGTTTVTATATEACGNTTTCSFTVTVIDTISPTITCPSPITVDNDLGLCSADVMVPQPTINDNCFVAPVELVANGDFNAATANWTDCGNFVETAFETAYGGSDPTNRVAEVDPQFGGPTTNDRILCQDVSGFQIGKQYELTFLASRRQANGAPNPLTVDVVIDGGALSTSVTRTNTTFALTPESFVFVATQTTHRLTISPSVQYNSGDGMILDDISILQVPLVLTNDFNGTDDASGVYPVGTTDVIWTLTDCAGNTAQCTTSVTVNDAEAPVPPMPPAFLEVQCASDVPAPVDLTATDNCDGPITVSPVPVITPGSCLNDFVLVRTWTFTDMAGNTTSISQTIVVSDTTAPAAPPPPADVNVACAADVPPPVDLTAIDNCDGPITVSPVPVITQGSCLNDFVIVRTWTFVDTCGNTSSVSQTITVSDTLAPVAPTPPADVNVACAADVPAPVDLTAIDNCDGPITVSPVPVITPGSCLNDFVMVRTWTFVDTCGNTSSVSQTITVSDTLAPVAPTPPADVNIACAADVPPPVDLTAIDNCDGPITVSPIPVIIQGSCLNDFVIVRTWTFVDTCGNTSSVSQTITVSDTLAPVAPAPPADVNVACAADVPAPVDLTAIDNCDGPITVSPIPVIIQGSCLNDFVIVRTWTFVDTCGNTSSVSQTITVSDTLAPVAPAPPADMNVQCAADVPPPVDLTAVDNCDGPITVSPSAVITPGSCLNDFVMVRTWTFVDTCGNTSSVSQTITVSDTMAPVFTCPSSIEVDADSNCQAIVTYSAIATDNCDGTVAVIFDPPSGSVFNIGLTTVTATATDTCGNSSSCTFVVSVEDNTPPVITCPPDVVRACDENTSPTSTGTATASDNCGISSIVFNDSTVLGLCSGNYTIFRTWTATDSSFNSTSCIQTITVVDTVAPEITCPADVTIQCDEDQTPTSLGFATATDNCDNNPVILFTDATTPGSCPGEYVITRTWSATDDCNNSVTCVQTITVIDTEAPVAPNPPADVTVECMDDVPAAAFLMAQDNCDGMIVGVVSDSITPGACVNEFTILRTWLFKDACNNAVTISQTIVVDDNTAPVAPDLPDLSFQCADDVPLPAGVVTALDNCDGTVVGVLNADTIPGSCVNNFVITRTYTFTDGCGNQSSETQTITVNDDTDPVATCPADVTGLQCGDVPVAAATTIAEFYAMGGTVSDNCSDTSAISISHVDVDNGNTECVSDGIRVITRTYTLTDECGNSTSCSHTFSYDEDTEAPDITCPADESDLDCNYVVPAGASDIASFLALGGTASDNCTDQANLSVSYVDVDNMTLSCPGDARVIVRTYTITDACGNSATCDQTFTYEEITTPPVIDCPADLVCLCGNPDNPLLISNWLNSVTGASACPLGVTITNNYPNGTFTPDCGNAGTQEVTFTIVDDCGNVDSCTANIIFVDNNPPELDCPAPIIVGTDMGTCEADIQVGEIVIGALDKCDPNFTITNNSPFALDNNSADIAGQYPVGSYQITFTATDACGNVSSCTLDLTVEDDDAPVISCPADITVYADPGECGASVNFNMPSYADNCPGAFLTQVSGMSSGDFFPTGTTVQEYMVIDGKGNTANCSFSITVINTLSSLCTVTGYAPGTPANFALFLNGLPGVSNPNFEWENGSGTLAVFLDGTATLKGKVINKGDPNVAFDVNILLENEMDWATWSALGRGYKANAFNQATADANHPGWTFWELSSSSKLIGSSGSTYDGDVLTLDPKPADYSYGFQLGLGANDKDNDYGISGWYYYSGDLGGQSVSGDGDVNGDASCQANPCGSGIAVAPRTMLEGNYNIGTQLMADNLRQAGLLPLLEPYSGLGFVHVGGGGESTTTAVLSVTGDDAIVDWVVVELRPQGNTSQIAATRSALLQRDGDIVDVDGVSPVSFVDQPEGNYHVAIYHRSHVPIMSEGAFSLLSSAAYLDFADGSVVSYGTNATKTMSGSVEGMYCGDADFDHTISSTDRALLWNYKNQTGYLNVDVDLDGACTASDRSFGWNNRNQVKQF